jgi:hypothetical protein
VTVSTAAIATNLTLVNIVGFPFADVLMRDVFGLLAAALDRQIQPAQASSLDLRKVGVPVMTVILGQPSDNSGLNLHAFVRSA